MRRHAQGAHRPPRWRSPGAKQQVVTVAKREYSVAAGDEKRLVLKLTKSRRASCCADGKIKVKAVQQRARRGARGTTFWLKASKG